MKRIIVLVAIMTVLLSATLTGQSQSTCCQAGFNCPTFIICRAHHDINDPTVIDYYFSLIPIQTYVCMVDPYQYSQLSCDMNGAVEICATVYTYGSDDPGCAGQPVVGSLTANSCQMLQGEYTCY